MLKWKKNDIYFVMAVAAIALCLICQRFMFSKEGARVVVQRDGKTVGTYSLAEEERLVFTSEDGGKNVLAIRDGKAYMETADCPDKLCVKQGAIGREGESIICLPHKLVIQVIGGEDREADAVAMLQN